MAKSRKASNLYTGIDNLEVMTSAKNYNNFLILEVLKAGRGHKTLVDFGAGIGTFDLALKDRGCDVVCVELDPRLQELLRQKGLPVVSGINQVDQPAEFIFSLNVLEHIKDDQSALADLFAAMAPGGSILLYVPAFRLLWSSLDDRASHYRRYRKANLVAMCERAGFSVQEARYVDSLGFAVTLVFKLIGNKNGDINSWAIAIFDRLIFPLNRIFDRIFYGLLGKNILLVAKKPS